MHADETEPPLDQGQRILDLEAEVAALKAERGRLVNHVQQLRLDVFIAERNQTKEEVK